jgi:hypothetical protein
VRADRGVILDPDGFFHRRFHRYFSFTNATMTTFIRRLEAALEG